ncbi:uncharacterized protein [Apostichopus japonicus]|uniref:uncharacterized protein n=1 Tax=Stichopus japonicus TaxID=307972 RepID=UPI003AB3A0EB
MRNEIIDRYLSHVILRHLYFKFLLIGLIMEIIFLSFLYLLVETGEAGKSCNDTLAQHPSGSSWSPVPCLTCHCHDGIKACALAECPRPGCIYTAVPDGQCCPVCVDELSCKFEGKTYSAHEQWRYLADEPCVTCRCARGETTCGIINCPSPPCNNPVIPQGECCPQCIEHSCLFRGRFHPNGDVWEEASCVQCRCSEGTVACSLPNCPNVIELCEHPTVLPNQCCPVCPRTINADRPQIVLKQFNVREERKTVVKLKVDVNFDNDGQGRSINITGNNMWRISAWFCNRPPKENMILTDYSLLNQQILTHEQSSVPVRNGQLGDMGIVNYNINVTGLDCSQIRYMCLSFDTVDTPQITESDAFVLSSSPSKRRLTACRMNWYCKRKLLAARRQIRHGLRHHY